MQSLNSDLLNYALGQSSNEDEVLSELNRETYLKVLYPNMLSGHQQGKLLEMISKMVRPKNILEIGTYTGYSAICLAKGLTPDGKLFTIERNDELLDIPKKYFAKAGLTDKIEILTGDALEIIPNMKQTFDLVFLDADKKDYVELYHKFIDKVAKGGFIIADNVLWYGKVLLQPSNSDKETIGIQNFNTLIKNDPRVENIILTIRDGINLIHKL
jgi:caffeoyl-CoA O-methyltransferase